MRPGCFLSLFRCKLQLLSICFIVLSISLLLIYQRKQVHDNQPFDSPHQLANRNEVIGGINDRNRKYNLMYESSGFEKLKRLFNSYNNKDCTLGKIKFEIGN